MMPDSNQSAESETKGLHLTQAGPDLIKKYAYLDAGIARRYDPQIAAIYYDQMVCKGKHHKQAVCACATHLLDWVLAVLRADKPYEVRDSDGTALNGQQARELIVERYTVPEEVRQRKNNVNAPAWVTSCQVQWAAGNSWKTCRTTATISRCELQRVVKNDRGQRISLIDNNIAVTRQVPAPAARRRGDLSCPPPRGAGSC